MSRAHSRTTGEYVGFMRENSMAETIREKIKLELVKIIPMECGCDSEGRCLVVCIDGTSNQFGEKNTNVIELYHLIHKDKEHNQLTWYNSGIGTYARPSFKSLHYYKQVIGNKIDLAIAWNFENTILAAYRWLSDNYEEGDRIFLFGFSRGAFQVRALSGMIHKVDLFIHDQRRVSYGVCQVGLIHKGNESQIPFAYELYADPKSDDKPPQGGPGSKQEDVTSLAERLKKALSRNNKILPEEILGGQREVTSMAERFKRAFSRGNVKVHFVGAWDTVSSIGFTRGKRLLPHTTNGMTHVCYFRHALALDERRVKFLPEYAYGDSTLPQDNSKETESTTLHRVEYGSRPTDDSSVYTVSDSRTVKVSISRRPQVKEVWFPGTHSDIGGGNVANATMDRASLPLRWMVLEAQAAGLKTKELKSHDLSTHYTAEVRESLKGIWWPFELLPFPRLSFSKDNKRTIKPHLGAGRKILPGQKIHASITWLKGGQYTPKARPVHHPTGRRTFWREIGLNDKRELLEIDAFDEAIEDVDAFTAEALKSDDVKVSRPSPDFTEDFDSPSKAAVERQEKAPYLPELLYGMSSASSQAPVAISELQTSRSTIEDKNHGSLQASRSSIGTSPITIHPSIQVTSSFSKSYTSSKVVGGSSAATIAYSTSAPVTSNEPNPKKPGPWRQALYEKLIVSLSEDSDKVSAVKKYRFLGLVMDILREPSSDGSHLKFAKTAVVRPYIEDLKNVQGYDPRKLKSFVDDFTERCLWVIEVPDGNIWTVAYSNDGKYVASGSANGIIRLWNAQTGESASPVFQGGHTDVVHSVAFSPNGDRLISGSHDKTICIWNVQTGKQIWKFLGGHTEAIWSVAISGSCIASGSSDKTVRLWNAATFKQIGSEMKGHNDAVYSDAFSPDGERIASGSKDNTIRLWNAKNTEPIGEPLHGHTGAITSVAFSPDGKLLISGSHDKSIRLWNLETLNRDVQQVEGHTDVVASVAFSPDGKWMVSSSWDMTVRLWNVETLEKEGPPLRGHKDKVRSVAFSPDGKRVVSGSADGTIRIWDVEIL